MVRVILSIWVTVDCSVANIVNETGAGGVWWRSQKWWSEYSTIRYSSVIIGTPFDWNCSSLSSCCIVEKTRCGQVILTDILPAYLFLFMAALDSRCRYILQLWFLSFYLLSFFPRLFSAVGDCMSTILQHMMWPWCGFRMHVWNVLHAAHWKYKMQNIAICTPSHKFVGLYLCG